MRARVLLLLTAALLAGPAAAASPPAPGAEPAREHVCDLDPDEGAWLQRALDAWSRFTGEILHIPPEPLPWIVTFDASCVWHVAAPDGRPEGSVAVETPLTLGGEPVPVHALSHDGTIELPSGAEVPARAMAFASVRDEGRATFFVLAMRSIWYRDQPKARGQDLDAFFLGVACHELVHTRQLVEMSRRVQSLEGRCDLPEDVGDTTIEEIFADRPELAAARGRERDLLIDAAAATDPARRRELARAALDHLRDRRARFFSGKAACYAELEDLLLLLEGTAVWAHFQLAGTAADIDFLPEHPDLTDRAEVLEIVRAKDGEWVQDAGFALFLLIDDYVAGWRDAVLGAELASPVELLAEGLSRDLG